MMEKPDDNILTQESIALSAKLDAVFEREKELIFFNSIVEKKIKNSNFNQSSVSVNPKLMYSILGVITILFLGIMAIVLLPSKNQFIPDNSSTQNEVVANAINEESKEAKDSVNVIEAIPNDISIKKKDVKPQINNEKLKNLDEEIVNNPNLSGQSDKQVNIKIIDGYKVSPRESVISTGLILNNPDYETIKAKLTEILTNFQLKPNFSMSNEILNISTNRYVGELKNGQLVLFNIQFKIFDENQSKLQIMLRFNHILNIEDVNKSSVINVDSLYYRQLKQEISKKLLQYLK